MLLDHQDLNSPCIIDGAILNSVMFKRWHGSFHGFGFRFEKYWLEASFLEINMSKTQYDLTWTSLLCQILKEEVM